MGTGGEFRVVVVLTSHCYGSLASSEITVVVIAQLFPFTAPVFLVLVAINGIICFTVFRCLVTLIERDDG